MFSNAIFSEAGIKKLNSLKNTLQEFNEKKFESNGSSPHSQEMVQNVIKIIDLCLKNNDIGYWKKDAKRDELLKLFDSIDGGRGTLVPEIFNVQSYELAKLLHQALEVNCKDILNFSVSVLIKNITDPDATLTTMRENLQHKIKIYEIFQENEIQMKNMYTVQEDINNNFNALDKRAKGLEKDSDDKYQTLKNDYATISASLLEKIKPLPYVRVLNATYFVNQKEPYKLKTEEFEVRGNRGACVWSLLHAENSLNKFLKERGYEPFTYFNDYYSKVCSKETCLKAEEKFANLAELFTVDVEKYKKGEFLKGFFKFLKSVNKNKIESMDYLNNFIKSKVAKLYFYSNNSEKNKENIAVGILATDIFKASLTATSENEKISKDNNISIGEFSRLVNSYGFKFLSFSLLEVNEANDSGILSALTRIKAEQSEKIKPVNNKNSINNNNNNLKEDEKDKSNDFSSSSPKNR